MEAVKGVLCVVLADSDGCAVGVLVAFLGAAAAAAGRVLCAGLGLAAASCLACLCCSCNARLSAFDICLTAAREEVPAAEDDPSTGAVPLLLLVLALGVGSDIFRER